MMRRPSRAGKFTATVLGRRIIGQQPRNQRTVLGQQLVYRRRDMFGFDLRVTRHLAAVVWQLSGMASSFTKARQTGKIKQWVHIIILKKTKAGDCGRNLLLKHNLSIK
jgi:hypothetical protein